MSIQENTSELETLLEQINNLPEANTNHTHNDLYYTKAESDELFENKADAEHDHDSLYYTKTQSDELLDAKADEGHAHSEYRIKTYSSFTQINLTNGSETIESIATSMPNTCELLIDIGASHATIYPATYGLLKVSRGGSDTRVVFEFYQKASVNAWYGFYDSSASTKWTGWTEIGGGSGDYVPIDGSTSMSGNLNITKATPEIVMRNTNNNKYANIFEGSDGAYVRTSDSSSVFSGLYIKNTSDDIENGIKFHRRASGESSAKYYNIFGEHNIDLLSSSLITTGEELTSGVSSLGKGKIHLVFEE